MEEEIFKLFGLKIYFGHLILAAGVAFFARVATRDKRYLDTYRAIRREDKFETKQEISVLRFQVQYLTECFKLLLDEKPEDLKGKIKARFSEVGKKISDFPLEIENAYLGTGKTEEPSDPRGFVQFVKDFLNKGRKMNFRK